MGTASKVWALVSVWVQAMVTYTAHRGRAIFRPLLFPFAVYRDRLLTRVGRIVVERLDVIKDEWREDIEGQNHYPDYVAARHRGRVREVNAILAQLQREFPSFSAAELGTDPFDMQHEVHSAINARTEVQPITAPRIVGRVNSVPSR
jgi:hypothetical protein